MLKVFVYRDDGREEQEIGTLLRTVRVSVEIGTYSNPMGVYFA